jgi:hypothetical protein
MPANRHTFTVCLLLTIAAWIAPVSRAQTFDVYGGWQQSPCTRGTTGHFYFEKAAGSWWMCTPAGNHFHVQGLANFKVPGSNSSTIWTAAAFAKYGNNLNTAATAMLNKFMVNYHFNTVGEDSNALLNGASPCTGCTSYPFFTSSNVSVYATVNLNNFASHPIKNYIIGVDDYFTNYTGAGCTDVFDPQYPLFVDGEMGTNTKLSDAYSIGVVSDDTDFQCGLGAGAEFDTFPLGHHKANWAYITLITSPIETSNPGHGNLTYQNTPELYADTTLYSKAISVSPPTSLSQCFSMSNQSAPPCSLGDYLNAEYATTFPPCAGGAAPTAVARLNQCWGSNYTTMGSSGTAITAFTCGTGDGTTVVFNCTLPTTGGNISPLSVAILEGGTLIGGDCYWVLGERGKCPLIGTAPKTPYNCSVAGSCMGVLQGPLSSTLQDGVQAFLSDNPCGTAGANPTAPHANFWAIVIWHGPGSYVPSRVTGETCAAGTGDSVLAPITPPTGATGYDVFMSCRLMDSNTPAFGCVGNSAPNSPAPMALQSANVALGTNFTVPSTGLVSGSPLPAPPSDIDYGTGAVKLTFSVAPSSGAAIIINAVAGGWMWGTGLMDEDGRHSWIGTQGICLTVYAGGGEGTPGYTCRIGNPENNAATSVAPNVGIDLGNWLYNIGARYFSTVRTAVKTDFPSAMYFGANTLGDWKTPTHRQLLEVANLYLDCTFNDIIFPIAVLTDLNQRLSFLEQHFGDKPYLQQTFLEAAQDSAESICTSCVNSPSTFATQAARGAAYYALVQTCLTRTGFNGDHQCVGFDWWGSADFNSAAEVNDWGLSTPSDNDYNGIEPATTSLACVVNPLLSCGTEPAPGTPTGGSPGVRPFGNLLTGPTGVIAANALWFQLAPPTNHHPSRKFIM